jgi:hypothetical protein
MYYRPKSPPVISVLTVEYSLSLVTNKFMLLYYTPSLLNSVNAMHIEGWLSCNLWCHRHHAMTETGSLQDCKSLDVQV